MEPLHRAAGRVVRHLLVDVERDLRGGDVDALAVVGELDRRGGHLNDGADEPFRQLAGHRDERHLLRGVGTVVHEDRGARRRFPAADLVDAEIAVAGDGCHDGQAVERDAVEAAAIDLPGEHRVLADGLGLAAHDAAACEHFSGPSLDVLAAHRAFPAGRQHGQGGSQNHERRYEHPSLHNEPQERDRPARKAILIIRILRLPGQSPATGSTLVGCRIRATRRLDSSAWA